VSSDTAHSTRYWTWRVVWIIWELKTG